jgi:hypothetical protein
MATKTGERPQAARAQDRRAAQKLRGADGGAFSGSSSGRATEALTNPLQLRTIRRDIARIKTILKERQGHAAVNESRSSADAGKSVRASW